MKPPNLTTYTLYRGVPYSGLDLDDLSGSGGYGWQMLGAGLYTTDCPEGASNYAQGMDACVYELELTVPEDDILRVDAEQVSSCEVGEAIPHIFGVSCGAFEIHIKNRETQKIVRYLVSTHTEDDLQREALEDVEGEWRDMDVVEEFFDDYDTSADPAELVEMEEYFKDELTEEIFDTLVEFKIRQGKTFDDFEASIRDYFFKEKGLSGEWDFIIDSTELAGEVRGAGYKVLWVEDNLLPYSEIVILDSDLYNNGLVIIDDCTDDALENPITPTTLSVLQSLHFEVDFEMIDDVWEGVSIHIYQLHQKKLKSGDVYKRIGDLVGWFQVATMGLENLDSICEVQTKELASEGYGTSTTPTLSMMFAELHHSMRNLGYGALLYLKVILLCMEHFRLKSAYITSNSCVVHQSNNTSDDATNVWLSLSKLLPSKIALLDIYMIDGAPTPNIGVSAYVTSRQIQTKLGLDVE